MEVAGAETEIRVFGTKFDIVSVRSEETKVLRGDKIKMLNEKACRR